MSLGSLGTLAEQRRGGARPTRAAAAGAPGAIEGPNALEQAVPTEVVVFYTTIVAACEAVLHDNADTEFLTFRVVLYLSTLAVTAVVAGGIVRPKVSGRAAVLTSAEWWTAIVAFAAWGLVLPGSFLYVWLDHDVLVVTVAVITATAGLVLGAALGPRLRRPARRSPGAGAGLSLSPTPPGQSP
jgi:hypothetical protein